MTEPQETMKHVETETLQWLDTRRPVTVKAALATRPA